jgi:hypothetical protein
MGLMMSLMMMTIDLVILVDRVYVFESTGFLPPATWAGALAV